MALNSFPMYLEGAPVKLYRGSLRLPLVAGTLQVSHNWILEHVKGNPFDWTQKLWYGGELSMSGLLLSADTFNLLYGQTWESAVIGRDQANPICTLWGLHRKQTTFSMEQVGRWGLVAAELQFRFDAYFSY